MLIFCQEYYSKKSIFISKILYLKMINMCSNMNNRGGNHDGYIVGGEIKKITEEKRNDAT